MPKLTPGGFFSQVGKELARRRALKGRRKACEKRGHVAGPGQRCDYCKALLCPSCLGLKGAGLPPCRDCKGSGLREEPAPDTMRAKVGRWLDEARVPWRRR